MGIYIDSLERLNAEYKDRTSISIFGLQSTMLRLLVDSYEVRMRFEQLFEEMKQRPVLFEDIDVDYQKWTDSKTWSTSMPFKYQEKEKMRQTAAIYGFSKESPFAQTYANRMLDALGDELDNIDADRFKLIVSSVVTTSDVIPYEMLERQIDVNIMRLRNTLFEIDMFKRTHKWEKKDYAQFYKNIYDRFISSSIGSSALMEEHQKWVSDMIVEPDFDDCEQRRRELLLKLFQTDFFKALRSRIHVPAEDDIKFCVIQDKKIMPDLTDTLQWYAAFKKLCPKGEDGMFSFDEDSSLGKYIYENKISEYLCWQFLKQTTLIEMVQEEMYCLLHPEENPPEDETIERFVDRVTKIMLKAEDRNGEIIKYVDNRNNQCEYKFDIDGKGFSTVMATIKEKQPDLIEDYLDNSTGDNAIGVTKVCPFVGCIVGLHIFNDDKVRNVDFEPAFQFVYGEKNEKGQKRSFIQKMSATKDVKEKGRR